MKILDPANTIFNVPNKITDQDFDGWVQARDVLPESMDPHKPLLESKDPGEQPCRSLVVESTEKGRMSTG